MQNQNEGEELEGISHSLDVLFEELPFVVNEKAGMRVEQLIGLTVLVCPQ